MKPLTLILRVAVVIAFIPIVWAVFFYDAAREHAKKKRLGAAYEGPAEE